MLTSTWSSVNENKKTKIKKKTKRNFSKENCSRYMAESYLITRGIKPLVGLRENTFYGTRTRHDRRPLHKSGSANAIKQS